jgi:PhoPQ-activated pathogenicity-related protein
MVEYRARFDANKNVQDLMKAKRLLISGEEELKKAMYWHTDNFNCKDFTYIKK